MAHVRFVSADHGSKIRLTLLDNEIPINLTNKAVYLRYSMASLAAVEVLAVIVDEAAGLVEYTWTGDELKPGRLRVGAYVLNGSEKISSLDLAEMEVRPHLA